MVPKDELRNVFLKLVENPIKILIRKDLSESKVDLEIYLKDVNYWFKEKKVDIIDKDMFNEFLDMFEEKSKKLLDDENIEEDFKPELTKIMVSFLVELETHCNYMLKIKLENIKNALEGKKKTTVVGKILKFVLPIIIILIVLGFVGFLIYSNIGNMNLKDMFGSDNATIQTGQDSENDASSRTTTTDNVTSTEENTIPPTEEFSPSDSESSPETSPAETPVEKNTYKLTLTEVELLNRINEKRRTYGVSELTINKELSGLLKNHTNEMAITYEIKGEDQFGDMMTRAAKVNITKNIIETNHYYKYSSGILSEELLNNIKNPNLYNDKYTHIALAVSMGENNVYFTTIDLYFVEE